METEVELETLETVPYNDFDETTTDIEDAMLQRALEQSVEEQDLDTMRLLEFSYSICMVIIIISLCVLQGLY